MRAPRVVSWAAASLTALLAAASLVSCEEPDYSFRCDTNDECGQGLNAGARCQPDTHACAFPDGTCTSGFRYGHYVPEDLFLACVAPPANVPDAGP